VLHEEPCTDPYARFCGQTGAFRLPLTRYTGRKTSGKVPFRLGSAVPQRQNPASEDGTIPCLFLHRSTHCQRSAPSYAQPEAGRASRRGRGSDPGGVYPESRRKLRRSEKGDLAQDTCCHRCKADPMALRAARSKKNNFNSGAAAWRALKSCLARLSMETSPASLFPRPPVIRFFPTQEVCGCGRMLVVQKTRRKSVLSMNGPFIAHETVYECRTCSRVFGSEELLRFAPSRCNVAYDILVFVGEALFRRHQTILEVRAELIVRNVRLSNSEIAYLGRKCLSTYNLNKNRLSAMLWRWIPTQKTWCAKN
jgi:hypothetical protein